MSKVLVIGRLGELVKKIYELELLIASEEKNETAAIEIAAYSSVLEAWPVEDVNAAKICIADLHLSLDKLAAKSRYLDEVLSGGTEAAIVLACAQYVQTRETVKRKIAYLNALGRWIGNVPMLEFE